MIDYTEKGYGLHQAVQAAGHALYKENDTWKSSNDDAVQAIIDAYNPAESARETARTAVAQERMRRQAMGVKYEFPDGQAGTVQTRDTQDLLNVTGLATRALMSGEDAVFYFRDEENETHILSRSQMADLAAYVSQQVELLYAAKWRHDSAIAQWDGSAAYDLTAFWPGE